MFYVFKDGELFFQGSKEEVAKKLKVSEALVQKCGSMLEYIKKGYQIVNDDGNKQMKTWLDDDLIIKRIDEGKTYKEIAKELKYPLPGFEQYCKARGYTAENKGHMKKKLIFYPGGYKQCPRCKRWFNNYARMMWHWRGLDKRGHLVLYCSYTCQRNSEVNWW